MYTVFTSYYTCVSGRYPIASHSDIQCSCVFRYGNANFLPWQIWATEQKRLIEVVHPHSQRVTLPGSDYLTFYLKPQAVARAVMDMVVDWRGHSHVAQ